MAPKSTPEDHAEKFHCAQRLGLPPEWRASVYLKHNNNRCYRFWDPSGNIFSSLGELAETLGTLPEGLQSGQEERLQCAQELGLPPGWRARVYMKHNNSRNYKFWDPSGITFSSLGELAEVLGTLPGALQSRRGPKPQAARTEAHEGGGPRSISPEEEAERLQCAEELGLPRDWRAAVHTKPNNKKAYRFWDPSGTSLSGLGELAEALGTLPEGLQIKKGHKEQAAAVEATFSSAPRRPQAHSAMSAVKDAERRQYAQEFGLPEGWGAAYYPSCRNYKFWDPSGTLYKNVKDLAKVLGGVPAGFTPRKGEAFLPDSAMDGDTPASQESKGETKAIGPRAEADQVANGDDPDAGSATTPEDSDSSAAEDDDEPTSLEGTAAKRVKSKAAAETAGVFAPGERRHQARAGRAGAGDPSGLCGFPAAHHGRRGSPRWRRLTLQPHSSGVVMVAEAAEPPRKESVARTAKRKASPDSAADAEPRAKGRKKVLAAPEEATAKTEAPALQAPAPDASAGMAALQRPAASGSPSSSSSSSSEDSSDSDSASEEEPPKQEPKTLARSAMQPSADARSLQPLAQSGSALPAKAAPGPAPVAAQPPKHVVPAVANPQEPARPAVVVWQKHWSPEFNIPYWWNRLTDESVWEPPLGVE